MDADFVITLAKDIGLAGFALYIVYKLADNHLSSLEKKIEELKNEIKELRATIERLVLELGKR